jgi:hypothetical protein
MVRWILQVERTIVRSDSLLWKLSMLQIESQIFVLILDFHSKTHNPGKSWNFHAPFVECRSRQNFSAWFLNENRNKIPAALDVKEDSRVSAHISPRMHTRGKVFILPEEETDEKVEKIREGLIHNAKVKRAYARTLKREEKAGILRPTTIVNESDQKENVEV